MLRKITDYVKQNLVFNINEARAHYTALGWVLLIFYIFFYFFNSIVATPNTHESLTLRIGIGLSGLLLIFYKYWPKELLRYEAPIFYLTLLQAFPFFFSYMLFKNQSSNIWQINELIGLVLLSFFVDWFSFIIISAFGVILALVMSHYTIYDFTINRDLIGVFGSYSPPVIYFIIFSRKKNKLREERNIYHSQIKQLNSSLEQQVSERTHELEDALSVKTEFLNNMSHEIRTPIQGVTLISKGLVEHWREFGEDERYKYACQVAKNAERLGKLVGNLLDLSRFEKGIMILDKQKWDLNQLVLNMVEECNMLYLSEKYVKLSFSPSKPVMINVDAERIGQVLRNLFTNAIKFSSENDVITAKVWVDQNQAQFSLSDQGLGIPEQELNSIFTAFYQSSRTKTRAGGTGLGLSISKEIIKQHDGKIWATNNESVGSSFYFSLPLSDKNLASIANGNDQTKVAENSKLIRRILIIDDEDSCHMSMNLMLQNTNFKLILANGGVDGLQMLAERYSEIDIILLDLMMPDIYGLNVLSEIKKHSEYDHIKIILQTGSSDMAEIDKAYILGIDGYIKKPYQKAVILAELGKV